MYLFEILIIILELGKGSSYVNIEWISCLLTGDGDGGRSRSREFSRGDENTEDTAAAIKPIAVMAVG